MIADGIVLCFQSQDGTATQRSACTPPTQTGWCGGRTSNEVMWPVTYAVVLILFSPDTLRCMIANIQTLANLLVCTVMGHSNTGKLVSMHSNKAFQHWQTCQCAQKWDIQTLADWLVFTVIKHSNTGKLVSVHSNGIFKHWQTGWCAQ